MISFGLRLSTIECVVSLSLDISFLLLIQKMYSYKQALLHCGVIRHCQWCVSTKAKIRSEASENPILRNKSLFVNLIIYVHFKFQPNLVWFSRQTCAFSLAYTHKLSPLLNFFLGSAPFQWICPLIYNAREKTNYACLM